MNDHIKSEISPYLAGSLTESRNRQIEAHTASCEKCRNALTKAKSKNARVKREALKKASSDPLPNLFLARQGKDVGVDAPSSGLPMVIVGIVLLAGGGFWAARHFNLLSHSGDTPAAETENTAVESSTATIPAPPKPVEPVVPSAGVPVAPAPTSPKAPTVISIQQQWKGQESSIPEARVVVIRNKEKWQKMWEDVQQKDPLPEVNFNQHVVVGILAGARAPGSTIEIGKIRDEDDEALYIPYRVISGPGESVGATEPVIHPYLFSLIPQIQKKIRLIEKEASR